MADDRILVIDEGTTSTRVILFAADGRFMASEQAELTQIYPADGLVEHDAAEIWDKTLACARAMVDRAGGANRIAAIGITNQRETAVAWDRQTGEPIGTAIVWQDRRTAALCEELREAGRERDIQAKTGLLLDPYFSASKFRWMAENRPEFANAGDRLAVGTIESWLIWKLTGGLHVTDATNASRTMLMPLERADWDEELLDLFKLPKSAMPEIIDCSGHFGDTTADLFGAPIPICGAAGDQQAATIGQACFTPGETKATFGTGAFILTNSGASPPTSDNRLVATVLNQLSGERTYALEGSIFVAGSLMQWLRDQIGMLTSAPESEELARSVQDNGGVYLVPALAGLGAPHWRADARAALTGMSFATTRAHMARAALEAISYQCHDLMRAFSADGAEWESLRVDGGMAANDWMIQDLADMLDLTVERPDFVETTALGAAMLAATGAGLYPDLESAAVMRSASKAFRPELDDATRQVRLEGWRKALGRVLGD